MQVEKMNRGGEKLATGSQSPYIKHQRHYRLGLDTFLSIGTVGKK